MLIIANWFSNLSSKPDDGRLCATHWGAGIGANSWRDADVVFLFDEFYLPKTVAVSTVQGLPGHRADEGDLASMMTIRSLPACKSSAPVIAGDG
jgi:hypothetical protein